MTDRSPTIVTVSRRPGGLLVSFNRELGIGRPGLEFARPLHQGGNFKLLSLETCFIVVCMLVETPGIARVKLISSLEIAVFVSNACNLNDVKAKLTANIDASPYYDVTSKPPVPPLLVDDCGFPSYP